MTSGMRILTGAQVAELADYAGLIEAIDAAMRRVTAREVELPLRSTVPLAGGNRFGVMPGALGSSYGAKLLSLFPDNPRQGRSSHAGLMLVFDPVTGLPKGCLAAAGLTALRTAAASAVATRALARADAAVLGMIGCGEEAASHVAALRHVRSFRRMVVWGRNLERAGAFAALHGMERLNSAAAVAEAADVLCICTDARTPLLMPEMLHAGLHINAVGASTPTHQEVATGCLPLLKLFTDYLPSLEAQAAEVIDARRTLTIGGDFAIAEIGGVLAGIVAGREGDGDVTLYRSLGVAAQDLAAVEYVLGEAEARGIGIVVDMS